MKKLEGKTAIVTGSASGIGKATAELFSREGAYVVVADYNFDGAQQVASSIGNALAVRLDAGEEDSIKDMVEVAVSRYGTVDVLVNNVGTTDPRRDTTLTALDTETWERIFRINARGTWLGTKYALPHMIKSGGGNIVNIASVAGVYGDVTHTAYGASKAAVINLTKYTATQYGCDNVRCNAISPGMVETPALKNGISSVEYEALRSHLLLDTPGTPQDIASAVLFLSCGDSRYVTGQNLIVDGGFGVHNAAYADFKGFFK